MGFGKNMTSQLFRLLYIFINHKAPCVNFCYFLEHSGSPGCCEGCCEFRHIHISVMGPFVDGQIIMERFFVDLFSQFDAADEFVTSPTVPSWDLG